MALINMTVYPRSTTGKNANRRTRTAGRVPAVVYGDVREQALNIELDTVVLTRHLATHSGQNLLFSLNVEGTDDSFVAVMRDLQQHPVSDEIYHCDLMQIPLGKPLTLEIGLNVHGEGNRFVRGGDAVVDVARRTVMVECLPRDVPETIDVNYSELTIGEKITVADLEAADFRILNDPEDVILKLNPHTFVEEEAEEEGVAGEEEAADEEEAKDKDKDEKEKPAGE